MRTTSGGAVRPIRFLPPVLRTGFLHYNRGKIRRAGNQYPGPSHHTSHGAPLGRRGANRGREVSPGRGYGGGVSAKPLSAILEAILVDALGLPAAAIQVRLLPSCGASVG